MRFELSRPEGLADLAWQSLLANLDRLQAAHEKDDKSLAVGTAKDLAEAVARIVVETSGDVAESNLDFGAVITRAHEKLRRQPGPGLTKDETVRNIASGAKTIVCQLPEIRNRYGTGHGRTVVPDVCDELIDVAVDASLLWSRWALRRLECLIFGWPHKLAADLRDGKSFRSGDLRSRLLQADLPNLDEAQQHLLGLAVAQRASRGTITVAKDGIERCVGDHDPTNWPSGYRGGLVEGTFLNRDGEVAPLSRFIGKVVDVLEFHPAPEKVLAVLNEKVSSSRLSRRLLDDDEERDSVLIRMTAEGQRLPSQAAQDEWKMLISAVKSSASAVISDQ